MGLNNSFNENLNMDADGELQSNRHSSLETSGNYVAPELPVRVGDWAKIDRSPARYPISNSIACFPILSSHEVDTSHSLVGVAINIGMSGIQIQVDANETIEGVELLIGVELPNGDSQYCSGVATSSRSIGQAAVEADVQFRGYVHEIMESEHIFPILNRSQMKFGFPYPEPILASLCNVGAAHAMSLDAVTLCPICHGIPTIRSGCRNCLSNNVQASKMIHHFACAHVDFVKNFEQENELCCQKCRTRRMIIGSDFEYLDGPNVCYDCGQANLEKIQIGHCLNCEYRFPVETAYTMEIVGYRVNRLDLLDFIHPA